MTPVEDFFEHDGEQHFWERCHSAPHPLACGHDEALVFVNPKDTRESVVTCPYCDSTS